MSVSASVVNGELVSNGVSAAQSSTTISKAVTAAQKESGGALDKDAFLKLLVTQMQYQDPLEPTDNTEYVSQLATFSTLEEMQNMSTSMNRQQASGLVGQYVFLETTDSTGNTKNVEGTVDFVTFSGSKIYLSVNGTLYDMDDLQSVADPEYTLGVKLADAFAVEVNKLPAVNQLTDDDLDAVQTIVDAYSSMTSYQKGFLTSDETAVYNEYASWLKTRLEAIAAEKEKENDGTNAVNGVNDSDKESDNNSEDEDGTDKTSEA